jgi:hypothetical protein
MADNVYTDITKRCAALQKKALAAVGDIDAFHYMMTNGSRFPYWTNRIGPPTVNEFNSEDIYNEARSVIMRLVIGHVTADYKGQSEDVLGGYIDDVYETFLDIDGIMLVDNDEFTTIPTYLESLGTDLDGGDTGLEFFPAPWMGQVMEVGIEFTLTVYISRDVEKA